MGLPWTKSEVAISPDQVTLDNLGNWEMPVVREFLKSYWALILLLIFIAGVWWAIDASDTFQQCISSKQSQANDKTSYEGIAVFAAPGIYRDCLGSFVVSQNPAITALSTFIIAVFTIVLAGVTNRQARLTKEALIADKAAFVFPVGFGQFWEIDPVTTHYNWRFRPEWRNSGDTAAKEVMIHAECEIRNTAFPPGHMFNYVVTAEQKGFIGPRETNVGVYAPSPTQAPITAQDLLDAQNGRKFIYLWGWTRYNDVFPGTPRHITKFCWTINSQGDPFTFVPHYEGPIGTPGRLAFGYTQHAEGNSANDDE